MKNLKNSLLVKSGQAIASLGFLFAVFCVNSACAGFSHQEKLPQGAKSLRKF